LNLLDGVDEGCLTALPVFDFVFRSVGGLGSSVLVDKAVSTMVVAMMSISRMELMSGGVVQIL
jgi:hypothetical protein